MKSNRDPLAESPPLRNPGERLADQRHEFLLTRVGSFAVIVAVVWVMAFLEWWQWLFGWSPQPVETTIGALIVSAGALWWLLRGRAEYRRLTMGLRGEKHAGQLLERIKPAGSEVLHDVPLDGFNADHVLLGPMGVFVIETKCRSLPPDDAENAAIQYTGAMLRINGYETDEPLRQAKSAAAEVSALIQRRSGLKVWVKPVVFFPGRWIDGPSTGRDVWVLQENGLEAFLRNERRKLRPEQVEQARAALVSYVREQRPPT